jgi:hypothetical protein
MSGMNSEFELRRAQLTTPRAAAIAGVLFSVLLIAALVLIRISTPADPLDAGEWLAGSATAVGVALNLVPFAGIAFLWFIGVVRDHLGEREDKFFATVFLGSGLLFLGMLFVAAAAMGGILIVYAAGLGPDIAGNSYRFSRALTYEILNTYAMRMAGVFMISSCTLFLRTGVTPRWMAWLGYGLALLLLLTVTAFSWISLVFPAWVLLISADILIDNWRGN